MGINRNRRIRMKILQEYSSQELFDELKRRNENFEILEIKNLDFKGVSIKDVVIKYGNDGYNCFLYAPHIKKSDNSLEFIYYDNELKTKIMPSYFNEDLEGIYSSQESVEKSLEIIKKCGMSYHRDDSFFID